MNRKRKERKLEKLENWREEKLNQYGWIAHFVPDDEATPNNINYHTHGLTEYFDHPDLQICLPLEPQIAHKIIADIIEEIKKGKRFEPGIEYDDLVAGDCKVQFIHAEECGRKVLRLVFPNAQGTYEGGMYKAQFTKLTDWVLEKRQSKAPNIRKTNGIKKRK